MKTKTQKPKKAARTKKDRLPPPAKT